MPLVLAIIRLQIFLDHHLALAQLDQHLQRKVADSHFLKAREQMHRIKLGAALTLARLHKSRNIYLEPG